MNDKKVATFAIFKNQVNVERAVDALKMANFKSSDISVLLPDKEGTKDFAHEKATKAPEGATTGGATGAVLGGAFGWLVGVGSLAIPGVGPFIAAGPIMAALAGAGIGTAVGGLTGALVGMGIPEYEAKRYEGVVKNGGILLSVHCSTDEAKDRAKKILESMGGEGIASTGEASSDTDTKDSDRMPGSTGMYPTSETPPQSRTETLVGSQRPLSSQDDETHPRF
jgi:hypothetical protein